MYLKMTMFSLIVVINITFDFITFCRRGFILDNFAVKTAPTREIIPTAVKYNRV